MTPEEYDGPDASNFVKVVRKLRKRLRQIQRLETCGRDLTTEERIKLECKNNIQRELREILAEINRRDESFNSSVDVNKEINLETDKEDSHELEPDDQHEEKLEKEKDCVFQNNEYTESVVVAAPVEQTNVTSSKVKRKILHEWKSLPMFTKELEGHHDIITSVDCDGNWLVSGSQDTSVKVWDLNSMDEVRNMTGHSGCVTCVQILNNCESDRIWKVNSMEFKLLVDADGETLLNKQKLLLTSSLDCFIKLWVIPDGCCVKSIYIFSPLTAMLYSSNLLFTGTDSGKLVVCDILSGSLVHESIIHTQEISSLKWHCNHLVTTSFDGSVKVWEATCDLHETAVSHMLEMEHLFTEVLSVNESSGLIAGRHIHCVVSWNDKLIIGDDGTNLKVVELDSGNITRYPNHKLCSGFTNSMFTYKNMLFATSYNVDTGNGAINAICHN
uniref:Mitochondrial division protein 1 n=1 Tax=Ciona intestinalis TaxID=7719 RepID=F6YUP9_CIOIN